MTDELNGPTASELSTTAGRTFLISAPMVGSKLTAQISPRLAIAVLVLDNVATLPMLTFGLFRLYIVGFSDLVGLLCHYSSAFFKR